MTFEELTPSQQAVLKRSVKLAERNICWPFAGYKMAPKLSSARWLVKKGLMIASSRTGVYFPSKAGEELVKDYKEGNKYANQNN